MITLEQINKDLAIINAAAKLADKKELANLKKLSAIANKAATLLKIGYSKERAIQALLKAEEKFHRYQREYDGIGIVYNDKELKSEVKAYFKPDILSDQIKFLKYYLNVLDLCGHLLSSRV